MLCCLPVLLIGGVASADEIGFQDLLDRLGAAAPTGAGIPVVQVEAGGAAYSPDTTIPEFVGKTFSAMSGAASTSWHATEVAKAMYGLGTSMSWGITNIYNYEAGNWAQSGYLKVNQGVSFPPATPPGNARIFNNSWIGSFGGNLDKEALRRADLAMNRDYTLFISGENNGAGSALAPLMCMSYNGLAVGVPNGEHSAGPTNASADGIGRQKPEIVAPGQFTSFATPVVSAAAALLYQTGMQAPLNTDVWASRGVVIKAVLLAGAKHRSTWANNAPTSGANRGIATQPLDPVYGVDTLNINRSHLILTAGRTVTATSFDSVEPTGMKGWMQHTFPLNSQNTGMYANLVLPTVNNTLCVVVTWNRAVSAAQMPGAATPPVLPNLDLTLYRRVGESITEISGPAGASVFDSGSCASKSVVDNIEHIFLRGLDPGDYIIEVKRLDAGVQSAVTAVAWFVDQGPLMGDFDQDGQVNGADLGILLGAWGTAGPTDLDGDGTTEGADLGLLLGAWNSL